MRIALAGVPGTGKTSLAKWLAGKMGCRAIHANEVAREKKLFSGKENGALVVKMKPLQRELTRLVLKEKSTVVEGHLVCEFPLPVDLVVVLRTRPSALRARLSKRGYPKRKVEENVEAEVLDYATALAEENYGRGRVFEVETSSFPKARQAIQAILKGKCARFKPGWVKWRKDLEKLAGITAV